ncbi:hypothetical protein DPMN_099939 [Dreissena polymorpha]|uniref:Uncharacterized protein n=1 Tax=Dreissena polymorpha TaxID=45954 RepID=A0A9D4LEV0_DREPO|nr:hypothetical protein DPMN_099939 [Dreissena polymorpha]
MADCSRRSYLNTFQLVSPVFGLLMRVALETDRVVNNAGLLHGAFPVRMEWLIASHAAIVVTGSVFLSRGRKY